MTRDDFRNAVFARDNHRCVICGEPAKDAHHILERRLFPDGGYYLNNGASLCEKLSKRFMVRVDRNTGKWEQNTSTSILNCLRK